MAALVGGTAVKCMTRDLKEAGLNPTGCSALQYVMCTGATLPVLIFRTVGRLIVMIGTKLALH